MVTDPAQAATHWRPPHRSRIAGLIWKTFAAGSLCSWNGGEIRYPAEERADASHFPEFPSAYVRTETPDWMSALLSSLDEALPSPETILAAMDDDSLTFGQWPAAFRMPSFPSALDAGHCLLSSRAILACRDEFLGPAFVDGDEACGWVEQASWLALMMGGEQAYLTAVSLAADPETFRTEEGPSAEPDQIETGD